MGSSMRVSVYPSEQKVSDNSQNSFSMGEVSDNPETDQEETESQDLTDSDESAFGNDIIEEEDEDLSSEGRGQPKDMVTSGLIGRL